jgi:capsular polysaccharide biosynthesis protein
MELRDILRLLWRRWWLVLIPPLIVGGLSLRNWRALVSPPVSYSTSVRFTVGQPPADPASGYDPRYYSWLTSEYIAAGLRDWVRGRAFAEAVSFDLAHQGLAVAPEQIQGAVTPDSARSVLVIYLNWPNAEELPAVAEAAIRVLETDNAQAFPQLGPHGAVVTPLDKVVVAANAPDLRARLDLPLRVGLALLAGLALAFVVDYLDPTVRSRHEVEGLGLEVLGTVPRRPWWRR